MTVLVHDICDQLIYMRSSSKVAVQDDLELDYDEDHQARPERPQATSSASLDLLLEQPVDECYGSSALQSHHRLLNSVPSRMFIKAAILPHIIIINLREELRSPKSDLRNPILGAPNRGPV